MSTALVVSDVDSCGERPPLKGLRKVTLLYVFSLLPLLQMANMKNTKPCLIGLRRLSNVKQLSNTRHVFF